MVADQGMLTTLYTLDPRDWALDSTEAVIHAVESDPRLVPGAIVLLHENHPTSVEAVPAIVHDIHARGLRLLTIPRLLADDPPTLAQQQRDQHAGGCVHLFR
jgi:peptidoglycan/xylan/chitin deacetylase (PgdA/CDA1 family)